MNKINKTILTTTIGLLGSIVAAVAQTASTPISATVAQPSANIQVTSPALAFSGILALPTTEPANYYRTETDTDTGTTNGVGTVAWNATIDSTWKVLIYTENSSDNSGLQSDIIASESLSLKFTNATLFGGIDTLITADAYGDDTDGDVNNAVYAFVPDVDEPERNFATDINFADIVLGEEFRFATKVTGSAIGGTYSTTVVFDLVIEP